MVDARWCLATAGVLRHVCKCYCVVVVRSGCANSNCAMRMSTGATSRPAPSLSGFFVYDRKKQNNGQYQIGHTCPDIGSAPCLIFRPQDFSGVVKWSWALASKICLQMCHSQPQLLTARYRPRHLVTVLGGIVTLCILCLHIVISPASVRLCDGVVCAVYMWTVSYRIPCIIHLLSVSCHVSFLGGQYHAVYHVSSICWQYHAVYYVSSICWQYHAVYHVSSICWQYHAVSRIVHLLAVSCCVSSICWQYHAVHHTIIFLMAVSYHVSSICWQYHAVSRIVPLLAVSCRVSRIVYLAAVSYV